MSEPFIGEIRMFGGNFAPAGWALCDGSLLPISSNNALFSILGTVYGGDGRTTFALPDLRGRVPLHPGSGAGLSTYRLGQRGGTESITLTTNNVPSHSHTASSTATSVMRGNNIATDNSKDPSGRVLGLADRSVYVDEAPNVDMIADSVSTSVTTTISDNTGGSDAVTNIQPFVCVNFIIALVGIFPSRT